MKLNRLFISAGLFAMALTGCTDLDMSPNSQYTEDPSQNSGVDPMIVVEAKDGRCILPSCRNIGPPLYGGTMLGFR